ncbi:MAG: hypothetical protein LUE97_03085 [Oscillospiraceae bacterium]|nr:hypothetical protein [Oscillospiraceae bacterium]
MKKPVQVSLRQLYRRGMVAMLEQWIRQTPNDPMTAEHLARLVCRITGTKESAAEGD